MSRGRGKYNAQRQYKPYRPEQLDPDNWAVIPEFGALPSTPDFEGFAFPLSAVKDREAAESLRTLLRIARKKIRGDFPTRAAVDTAALIGLDVAPHELTEQHRSAMAFRAVEDAIAHVVNPNTPERFRLGWLAHAGAVLAAWQSGDPNTLARTLVKSQSSRGGIRSGEVRKKTAIDKAAVRAAAQVEGWPEKKFGVLKKLGNDFDCTSAYIGEILNPKPKKPKKPKKAKKAK